MPFTAAQAPGGVALSEHARALELAVYAGALGPGASVQNVPATLTASLEYYYLVTP